MSYNNKMRNQYASFPLVAQSILNLETHTQLSQCWQQKLLLNNFQTLMELISKRNKQPQTSLASMMTLKEKKKKKQQLLLLQSD